MTNLRIAHAGCDASIVRKLNLTVDLLRGRGFRPVLHRWEGAGVDLVVTDRNDGFGQRVADIASRRSIPLLIISNDEPPSAETSQSRMRSISRERPVVDYFRLVEDLLGANPKLPQTIGLETLDRAKGKQLSAGTTTILVDGDNGSCRALSHRDLAAISHHMAHGRPVELMPAPDGADGKDLEVSVSLESFVFNALVSRESVQWKGREPVKLSGWPDINSKRYGGDVASLSAMLLGKAVMPKTLFDKTSEPVAASFLHACRVAGLLEQESGDMQEVVTQDFHTSQKDTGVVAALRRWLKV